MIDSFIDALDLRILDELQRDAGVSNVALAQRVGTSAATCLRRVGRLRNMGVIERHVALLSAEKLAPSTGWALTAIAEVTLDRQGDEAWAEFEARLAHDDAVRQCYRVSPGPDFVLVLVARDMPDYLATAQRLFTSDANVRNVKTYFSIKRSKFLPGLPLPRKPLAISDPGTHRP